MLFRLERAIFSFFRRGGGAWLPGKDWMRENAPSRTVRDSLSQVFMPRGPRSLRGVLLAARNPREGEGVPVHHGMSPRPLNVPRDGSGILVRAP